MSRPQPTTLDDWQSMFAQIYGRNNSRLDASTIWIHMVEEMGEVAKDLRTEDFGSLKVDLPDVFAWLCAFADREGISVAQATWDKYPGVCPYCLRPSHCVCIGGGYEGYDESRVVRFRTAHRRPDNLSDWQKQLRTIYGNVNRIVVTTSIGFHLMEEIGEMAKQLREGNHRGYSEGIADVFVWIMALSMKLADRMGDFESAVWHVYPGVCKRCKMSPCDGCDPQSLTIRG
ncbi:MAG: MazG nucleotide pyrophosphohydrolase domain-containing protein [Anaerolineae bacterium]